jgi:hypothetical protein
VEGHFVRFPTYFRSGSASIYEPKCREADCQDRLIGAAPVRTSTEAQSFGERLSRPPSGELGAGTKYVYHNGNCPDEVFDLLNDLTEQNDLSGEYSQEELDRRRDDLPGWREGQHHVRLDRQIVHVWQELATGGRRCKARKYTDRRSSSPLYRRKLLLACWQLLTVT